MPDPIDCSRPLTQFMKAFINPMLFRSVHVMANGSFMDVAKRDHAYEILDRANYFLTCDTVPTESDRIDCLSNLRRAFTQRFKELEGEYHLRDILETAGKRHYMELLAEIGIIRPLVLRQLMAARNEVEYNFSNPPTIERCNEFFDAVWYLLKVTDQFLTISRNSITLVHNNDNGYTYEIDLKHIFRSRFKIALSANVPEEYFSKDSKPSWLAIEVENLFRESERDPKLKHEFDPRPNTDLFIQGKIPRCPSETMRLVRVALSLPSS